MRATNVQSRVVDDCEVDSRCREVKTRATHAVAVEPPEDNRQTAVKGKASDSWSPHARSSVGVKLPKGLPGTRFTN